jgi:hypothetical protein
MTGLAAKLMAAGGMVCGLHVATASGTFYFFDHTDRHMVVAIDSRDNLVGGEKPIHSDDACKVIPLDRRTVFFSYGLSGAERPRFDVYERAKRAVAARRGRPLASAVRYWAAQVRRDLGRWMRQNPAVWNQIREGNPSLPYLEKGYFARDEGTLSLYGVAFVPSKTPPYSTRPVIERLGKTERSVGKEELLSEILGDRSERAHAVNAEIQAQGDDRPEIERLAVKLQLTTQAILRWADDERIGGDVAVMILEKGRRWRWFHRPDACARF